MRRASPLETEWGVVGVICLVCLILFLGLYNSTRSGEIRDVEGVEVAQQELYASPAVLTITHEGQRREREVGEALVQEMRRATLQRVCTALSAVVPPVIVIPTPAKVDGEVVEVVYTPSGCRVAE